MSIRFLGQFPTEQHEKQRFINLAITEINSGEVDPLKAIATLKHIEDVIKSIQSDPSFQSILQTEVSKYGKGEKPTALGYEISISQRRNFDYSGCGDALYEDMKNKAAQASETIKAREKFLQSLTQTIIDAENGGFEIKPPMVSYTTFPVLKAVKQGVELPKETGLPF